MRQPSMFSHISKVNFLKAFFIEIFCKWFLRYKWPLQIVKSYKWLILLQVVQAIPYRCDGPAANGFNLPLGALAESCLNLGVRTNSHAAICFFLQVPIHHRECALLLIDYQRVSSSDNLKIKLKVNHLLSSKNRFPADYAIKS